MLSTIYKIGLLTFETQKVINLEFSSFSFMKD